MLTEHDTEVLWSTADHLVAEQQLERASVLVKSNVARTFSYLNHSAEVIEPITFTPDTKVMRELSELDRRILHCVVDRRIQEANRYFIDYLGAVSKLTSYQKEELLAAVLASRSSPTVMQTERPQDDYYTSGDAAKKLGVSEQTIRRHCEQGRYPEAIRTDGGHWRIPKSYFRTTEQQDAHAEEVLKRIDERNASVGEEVDEFDL